MNPEFIEEIINGDILNQYNKEDITKLCIDLGKYNYYNVIDNILKKKSPTNNVTKESLLIMSNYCSNDEEALLKSLSGDIKISKVLTNNNINNLNKVLDEAVLNNNIDYIEYLLTEKFISKEDAARYLINNK